MAKVGPITDHERVRRSLGRSVTDVARGTGYSHSYVSQIEGRKCPASRAYRSAAARFLGVPEDVLFPEG